MENIVSKADCCGCAACQSICGHQAISMHEDEQGFPYPVIDKHLCMECGLCVKACPVVYRNIVAPKVSSQAYYACHNNDDNEWQLSSSGGLFGLMAQYVLDQGGVVVGAAYNNEMVVTHVVVDNVGDLKRLRGSKYVQSNTIGIYPKIRRILREDKFVLFSGTPCQVEALKTFLKKSYEKLICCDIICTSVPSPMVFRDYISFLSEKYQKKVTHINMKDKTLGWPFAKTRIFFEDGKSIFDNLDADLWIKIWASKMIDRPSCTNCRFTNYNRPGDVSIGDCWSVFHQKHKFFNRKGISQLIVNTQKGEVLFDAIKDKLTYIPITKEFAWQSKLERPITLSPLQSIFWREYRNLGFKKAAEKYWDYSILKYYKSKCLSNLLKIKLFLIKYKNKKK